MFGSSTETFQLPLRSVLAVAWPEPVDGVWATAGIARQPMRASVFIIFMVGTTPVLCLDNSWFSVYRRCGVKKVLALALLLVLAAFSAGYAFAATKTYQ